MRHTTIVNAIIS